MGADLHTEPKVKNQTSNCVAYTCRQAAGSDRRSNTATIRQHASAAYVSSIRQQHTSAATPPPYASIRQQHTSAYVSMRPEARPDLLSITCERVAPEIKKAFLLAAAFLSACERVAESTKALLLVGGVCWDLDTGPLCRGVEERSQRSLSALPSCDEGISDL